LGGSTARYRYRTPAVTAVTAVYRAVPSGKKNPAPGPAGPVRTYGLRPYVYNQDVPSHPDRELDLYWSPPRSPRAQPQPTVDNELHAQMLTRPVRALALLLMPCPVPIPRYSGSAKHNCCLVVFTLPTEFSSVLGIRHVQEYNKHRPRYARIILLLWRNGRLLVCIDSGRMEGWTTAGMYRFGSHAAGPCGCGSAE
jgi:hypothetical protein